MKNIRRGFLFKCFIFASMFALLMSFSGTAGYADTIHVTTLSDDDGGSLRAAIASADSYDVISFEVTGTIILDTELSIDHGLTIQGPGAEDIAISGNDNCRVFNISRAESVDISGLSIVSGDAGGGNGGGIYNVSDKLTVEDVTFTGNSAKYGGGMYNASYSDPTVTNCTFTGNSATHDGAGMYNNNSSPTVTNCIFWGNTTEEIYNVSSSVPDLSFCVVQSNDVGDGTTSNDIISADPKLQDPADNGGPTQTCALEEGSSAIDSGLTIGTISTDQRGFARPWPEGGSFDIGAYEYGAGEDTPPDEDDDNGSVTSGGGCNLGLLSPMFPMILLPLLLMLKK